MEEEKIFLTTDWKVVCIKNSVLTEKNYSYATIAELEKSGYEVLKANIPNCLENVLFENGKSEDFFYSDNIFKNRKNEYLHHFWFRTFDGKFEKTRMTFEGIDTVADIIVNGKLVAHTENMFVANSYVLDNLREKDNELIVHIYPAVIEARKYEAYPNSYAGKYNRASLPIRKCASSYGWDILPRIICGGIYRPVYIEDYKSEKINDYYLYTKDVSEGKAYVELFYDFDCLDDEIENYYIEIRANCGESFFSKKFQCWFNKDNVLFEIENCKLWWPKCYGEQNLYSVELNLYKKDVIIDSKNFNFGIRTVLLDKTSWASKNGKFNFIVNGKKIFILGTNWVPVDVTYVNAIERMTRCIEYVDDLGCNAIRIWGGGVYESTKLFEICDAKGILVWQDFTMGCSNYPEDERMCKLIREEVRLIIKKYRQYASLIVWAGDNECDIATQWNSGCREPFYNKLTREIIPEELRKYDGLRPYLPSSPYIDERAFQHLNKLVEDHLWGPRDYFKGKYYLQAKALFSSEIGYHGLNSSNSLKRFLKNPCKIFNENGSITSEFLAHATAVENSMDSPYAYRINLFIKQIDVLFGNHNGDLDVLCKKSQISQAEALKYFIERFRVRRSTHGGIIWWNILDGWPQISDAVIDYYFVKKLAYYYIKRSQQSVVLIMEECNGTTGLFGVNDTLNDETIVYTIKNIYTDELITRGKIKLKSFSSVKIQELQIAKEDKSFYYIEWHGENFVGTNHFHTNLRNIDYEKYMSAIKKVKYDNWEGF